MKSRLKLQHVYLLKIICLPQAPPKMGIKLLIKRLHVPSRRKSTRILETLQLVSVVFFHLS